MATAAGKRPKIASIQRTAVDQASSFLEDLPEKPKETFSLREAVNRLREQIQATLAKGYSYEEVAVMLNGKGIEISPSTLKNYVPSGKRQSSKDPDAAIKTPGRRGRKPRSETAIAPELISAAPAETESDAATIEDSSTSTEALAAPKRGRGRRKATADETPAETAPKRGRGRASTTAKQAAAREEAPVSRFRARATGGSSRKAASAAKKAASDAKSTTRTTRGRKKLS